MSQVFCPQCGKRKRSAFELGPCSRCKVKNKVKYPQKKKVLNSVKVEKNKITQDGWVKL